MHGGYVPGERNYYKFGLENRDGEDSSLTKLALIYVGLFIPRYGRRGERTARTMVKIKSKTGANRNASMQESKLTAFLVCFACKNTVPPSLAMYSYQYLLGHIVVPPFAPHLPSAVTSRE